MSVDEDINAVFGKFGKALIRIIAFVLFYGAGLPAFVLTFVAASQLVPFFSGEGYDWVFAKWAGIGWVVALVGTSLKAAIGDRPHGS